MTKLVHTVVVVFSVSALWMVPTRTSVCWAGASAPPAAPGLSDLVDAVLRDDLAAVETLLISRTVGVNDVDKTTGFTPLMWAANAGYPRIVTLLLAHGANPNATDSVGQTALFLAMSKPLRSVRPKTREAIVEIMRTLIKGGANIEAQLRASELPQGVTPLRYAAATELEAMRVLIEAGANVNVMDSRGTTPLMAALDEAWGPTTDDEALGKVQLLVAHGAVVDATVNSLTPLMVALWNGLPRSADVLIGAGAQLSTSSNAGVTMLMFAARAGSLGLVQRLLDAGADPKSVTQSGETALFFATAERPFTVDDAEVGRIVELLLARGALPDTPDGAGVTPLMMAARSGSGKSFDLLLSRGANAKATDTSGATLLMHAAAGGNTRVISKLLSLGLDSGATDRDGDTPLHWAAARHRPEAIELLLSTGASIDTPNGASATPLRLALHCDDDAAARASAILIERGALAEGALGKAMRCDGPVLLAAVMDAIADRAFRTQPPPEEQLALVWTATATATGIDTQTARLGEGGASATPPSPSAAPAPVPHESPNADTDAAALAGVKALMAHLADVIQPASGFPRVVDGGGAEGLAKGKHVLAGVCTREQVQMPEAVLRALNPAVRVVPVKMALAHQGCPLVLFNTKLGATADVPLSDGSHLRLLGLTQERMNWAPHRRFEVARVGSAGELLGYASHVDVKYQRHCPGGSYEESIAREETALRLIVGCVQLAVGGRSLGRVLDVYRFTAAGGGVEKSTVQKWSPPE